MLDKPRNTDGNKRNSKEGEAERLVAPKNLADLTSVEFVGLAMPSRALGSASPGSPSIGTTPPVTEQIPSAALLIEAEAATKEASQKTKFDPEAEIANIIDKHFGDNGLCKILNSPSDKISAETAKAWIELPSQVVAAIKAEADQEQDPERRKFLEKHAGVMHTAIQSGKRDMDNDDALTPTSPDKLRSSFGKFVAGMLASNTVLAIGTAVLGTCFAIGAMGGGVALATFGVLAGINRAISSACLSGCKRDFELTVNKAFGNATEQANAPIKHLVYTAMLAYMIEEWKGRAVLFPNHLTVWNGIVAAAGKLPLIGKWLDAFGTKDLTLATPMGHLQAGARLAMKNLYTKSSVTGEAMRDTLFDQTLKRIPSFAATLEGRWTAIPSFVDWVSDVAGKIGIGVGGVALVGEVLPRLFS